MSAARNFFMKVAGLALGTANNARHRVQGYSKPREFSSADVERSIEYAKTVVDRWVGHGLDPKDRRILELGPGPDLGPALLLISMGATSYTAVDRFRLLDQSAPSFNERLADACDIDLEAALSKISYLVTRFPAMPDLAGPFDAFVSSAALEHFDDVEGTFERLRELSAPEAVHCHLVDPQTHMRWVREADPWNLLRYSERTYRLLLAYPGCPNRLLASDYLRIAGQNGIDAEVIPYEVAGSEYLASAVPTLDAAFRNRIGTDLNLLSFFLVGRARRN